MLRNDTIALALIHNNNEERNARIRPSLSKLTAECEFISSLVIDISYQSAVYPHSNRMAFTKDAMYKNLSRKWRRYRLDSTTWLPRDILRFTKKSIRRYIFDKKKDRETWKKLSPIEVAVTDKHIRAWSAFLDTDADYLLCFEDDAVFKQDSIPRLADLNDILDQHKNDRIYIDLAGGCSQAALKISKLEINHDGVFRHYSKPATNSACVYLMSRSVVQQFNGILAQKPWLRLMAVDLMMNQLFTIMEHYGIKTKCMHADPTIFNHGSTTGECTSWFPGH